MLNSLQIGEYDDLNTEAERKLGGLIKAKFGTDFFIMYRFPLEVTSRCTLCRQALSKDLVAQSPKSCSLQL